MQWINILHAYQPPDWDPAIIDRVNAESYWPLVAFLRDHPRIKLTLNIAGSLTEQLVAHGHKRVIHGLKELAERGQIELMGMPIYHPIIPFLSPDELARQVTRNTEVNRSAFGAAYHPTGFFPPELAVNHPTGQAVEDLGFQWIVLDELAFNGHFNQVNFNQHYRWRGTSLRIVFRQRRISDFLAFELQPTMQGFTPLMHSLGFDGQSLVTAMDAENLGHHRPGAEKAWQALITLPDVQTLTVSEYLRFPGTSADCVPVPTSWSTDSHDVAKNIPYPLWDHPENPVHQALRSLARTAQATLLVQAGRAGYTEARERLDRALASDVYWWASMRPWWDAPIVRRETSKLARSLDPLRLSPDPLASAWQRVDQCVTEWETSGRAAAGRAKYLDDHRTTRFFAGQHIT